MAGTFTKPKNYNRRYVINFGTVDIPKWYEVRQGIENRSTSVDETIEEYFYMANEGAADSEVTEQTVTRSFTGHRFFGDDAQDILFDELFDDLSKREVEYVEFYDNKVGVNGKKIRGTISFSDDGSGATANRESIGFTIRENGKPIRGTVEWDPEENTVTFTEME